MGLNDENGNKTIARTMHLPTLMDRDLPPFVGVNLLVNPVFENLTTEHTNGITLHTNFSNTFQYAPGWYNFGADNRGSISGVSTQTNNPFRMKGNKSGVLVTQNQNYQYGLCQPIPRAAQLSGRRVRVTGAYEVKTGPGGGVQAGMSVFLVTKVNKQAVDADQTATAAPGEKYWSKIGGSGNYDSIVFENHTDLKHVVRIAATGKTYETGEELFNRAFDWWDQSSVAPNINTRILIGAPNTDGTDAEGVGANGEKPSVDVYYLGAVNTPADGSGTTGMLELAKDVAAAGSGLQTFEAYVDIPSAMFADDGANGLYQDAWIVVMPVHPGDVAAMAGNAEVRVWALSLEVIVQSAADRLLYGMQLGAPAAPFGAGLGGFPDRHLLRYPIYVPALLPLDVHGLQYEGDAGTSSGQDFLTNSFRFHTGNGYWEIFKDNIACLAKQATLPPGSSVLKASFHVYNCTDLEINSAQLYQSVAYDPQDTALDDAVTYPNDGNIQELASWGTYVTGTQHQQATVNAVRNRIGQAWPRSDTTPLNAYDGTGDAIGGFDDISTLAAASLWFRIEFQNGVNTGDFVALKNGWVLAAIDPRWAHFEWKRNP